MFSQLISTAVHIVESRLPRTMRIVRRLVQQWGEYAKTRSVNGIALFMLVNMASGVTITASNTPIHQESAIIETSIAHRAQVGPGGSRFPVVVTAYSSDEDQTDSTPFITASGERVRDGIVAANFLPFGTKIKIPKLFGDKVFVVKDRMAKRFSDRVDVWVHDRIAAQRIGLQNAEIIVL